MSTSGNSPKNNGKATGKGSRTSTAPKIEKELYQIRQDLSNITAQLKTQAELLKAIMVTSNKIREGKK